jgi:hypothetical protein
VFPVVARGGKAYKEVSTSAKRVLELVESHPGCKYAPRSWWNALNASCFYIDHMAGRTQDTRLTSSWFGPGRSQKELAVKLALKFAEL